MRPPGWPAEVADPENTAFLDTAVRWMWEVSSLERSPASVWARHPRALAFRVTCDLEARIEGTRRAYSQARVALVDAGVDPEEVLRALEVEAADLQRRQREVTLVGEALEGRRWQARL